MTFQIINPESLGAPRGWSHGMLAPVGGRVLFVAGQDARGPSGGIVTGGFVEQFAQVLRNILTVVEAAGGTPESIGRLTIFVADIDSYRSSLKPLGKAYREIMGSHYPAMALVAVDALVDEKALVEIEATAVLQSRGV